MKYFLRGLLYNKEVAALQKSLSSCPTFVPWDVEIRPCTSGSSNECQQRASRSTELQFPPSIASISRSLFANSRALAKSFSSVVFLVRLSRQFGLTGRKAAWRSEISSRYNKFDPFVIETLNIITFSLNFFNEVIPCTFVIFLTKLVLNTQRTVAVKRVYSPTHFV